MNRFHNARETTESKVVSIKRAGNRRRKGIDQVTYEFAQKIVERFWGTGNSRKVADSHNVERAGVHDEAVMALRRKQLELSRRVERLESVNGMTPAANVVEMPRRARFARAVA